MEPLRMALLFISSRVQALIFIFHQIQIGKLKYFIKYCHLSSVRKFRNMFSSFTGQKNQIFPSFKSN